ncbi:hypothetical protein OPQ81_011548 [Rhizoctonia solani]|nr:hypothetical protein OPQ81_011548 [Rhizoctonia solani]
MIHIPRQAPVWGSVALVAFAAASASQGTTPRSPNPIRASYKAPGSAGHSASSYPASIVKRNRKDVVLNGSGRYISQGPFALKGWSAHGVTGSRVNRRHEFQHR